MEPDDFPTLRAATITILLVPFRITGRVQRGRPWYSRALITLAFSPGVLLYEAFAVPLVAGSVLAASALMLPIVAAVTLVRPFSPRRARAVRMARIRSQASVLQETGLPPAPEARFRGSATT